MNNKELIDEYTHLIEIIDNLYIEILEEKNKIIKEAKTEMLLSLVRSNERNNIDKKRGQYILKNPIPQPAFAREISKEVRSFVLDRNGYTCQMCGAVAGEQHPYEPSRNTRLHIGHIIDKSMGGTDDPSNLRALCSICNEGAANLTLDRPSHDKLLIQVRRATGLDQLRLLEWLIMKFPNQAKILIEKNEE